MVKVMSMKKTIMLTIILIFVCFPVFVFAEAKTTNFPKVIDDFRYLLYIPEGIELDKKYPLVIALSPSADAQTMIEKWEEVAKAHKWLILASKEFRNGIDSMDNISDNLAFLLKFIAANYPVDKSKVIMTGFSGGGMQSHAFSFYYPELIFAIVVNTGMMEEYYNARRNSYPKGKRVVFLASPTDFRYHEMERDKDFLVGLNWQTKWIEFEGGHILAPASAYEEAAQWLEERF